MVKKVRQLIVGMCICILLSLTITGCGKSEDKKETSKKTENVKKDKIVNLEDKTSNLGHYARAMGAVLFELNDGDSYVFGGYEKNKDNKEGAINILKSSWNIENREDLIKTVNKLLKKGDRKDYLKESKTIKKMSKKKLKTALKQLSGEMLYHYENAIYNRETWGKKGLLAWDMCRISHLAQWGYIADYLSLEEAQAIIEPAAVKLQKNFDNWDDVVNNWLDGYCYIASVDRNAKNTDYTVRKNLYSDLLKEQKKDELLFDNSLFSDEITPLKDISYTDILGKNKK